uniref:Uncharacterized protein n=1 Tax=Rhizophora mucronata TaxID=61149 RepID=A0A2P2QYX6_RHIMU
MHNINIQRLELKYNSQKKTANQVLKCQIHHKVVQRV